MSDLFDFQEESNYIPSKLQVVKAEFIEASNKDWQELFEGYDELYAITYSNGLNFTCNLLSKFKRAEIILGCENVVDSDMAALLASQITSLDLTLKNKTLRKLAQ